jgi:hypothetical protein
MSGLTAVWVYKCSFRPRHKREKKIKKKKKAYTPREYLICLVLEKKGGKWGWGGEGNEERCVDILYSAVRICI